MAKTATAKRAEKRPERQASAWSHGSFYWNELLTRDLDRAKRFYKDTIGWTFEAMSMAGGATYWCAMLDGKPVAGLFPLVSPDYDGVPEGWMSYLAVDDVDKRVAKALKAGAKLMKPIFDVPGVGRIAVLTEPGGAGVGWMTPVGSATAKA
jgi:predicted enzyme related to lactoylglutathione lyase